MLFVGVGVVQAVAALHDGTALRRDVGSWWAFGAVRAAEGNSGGGRRAEGLGGSKVGVIFGASSASEGVVGSAMALRLRIEIAWARPPEMVLAFHAVFVDASIVKLLYIVQDVGIEGVSINNILYYLLAVRVSHQRLLDVWQALSKALRCLLRQQVGTCRSLRNRGQRRAHPELCVPRRRLKSLADALCCGHIP